MNRKAFLVVVLMAVPVICGLGSCLSNKGPHDINNPKDNLDWEGVYTGSFLTNSGYVLNVRITLSRDQGFELYYEYADGSHEPFSWTGSFRWDDTGSIIMVEIIDAPSQYKVAKDKLIRLDVYDYALEKER